MNLHLNLRHDKTLKITGIVFLVMFGVATIIAFSNLFTLSSEAQKGVAIYCLYFLGIGVLFTLLYHYGPQDWNEMLFEERCKYFADQLRRGNRKWYFTLNDNGQYDALPLAWWDVLWSGRNKKGGLKYSLVDMADVKYHLIMGKISNVDLVTRVFELMFMMKLMKVPDGSFYRRANGEYYYKESMTVNIRASYNENEKTCTVSDSGEWIVANQSEIVTVISPVL